MLKDHASDAGGRNVDMVLLETQMVMVTGGQGGPGDVDGDDDISCDEQNPL